MVFHRGRRGRIVRRRERRARLARPAQPVREPGLARVPVPYKVALVQGGEWREPAALAADVVEAGAYALNPRGELYTNENVRQALAARNLLGAHRLEPMRAGLPPPRIADAGWWRLPLVQPGAEGPPGRAEAGPGGARA